MTTPIRELLVAHPLPDVDGDKGERGTAVIVAGSLECPGAARLAATAALRVGAGKAQIVTHPELTVALGVDVPEALVVAWDPEEAPTERVKDVVAHADAVLVGPGLGPDAGAIARAVGQHVGPSTPLLLDAVALSAAGDLVDRRLVLLPNADEAAELVGGGGGDDLADVARQLAEAFEATVAVRGEDTAVCGDAGVWSSPGHPGLGTAGSGDVLAGAVAGLIARGIEPLQALAWAVAAHAAAGGLVADEQRSCGYGYLARELVDALPTALARASAATATT